MPENKVREIFNSPKFSFGSTSAIITNVALIIGLDTAANAKLTIIGSLLMIAIADNISDSLGIHMYQESEGMGQKKVWTLTLTNFLSRLIISLGFVFIILAFPLDVAVTISLIYGALVLSAVSYLISKKRKANPWYSIAEHLLIAVTVIIISNFFGNLIINLIK